jgi:hypothetical protein
MTGWIAGSTAGSGRPAAAVAVATAGLVVPWDVAGPGAAATSTTSGLAAFRCGVADQALRS